MLNLIGMKFGKLIVINYVGIQNRYTTWLCICECGKENIARGSHLKSGAIKSCGCEAVCITTHGLKKHPMYGVWQQMKDRCYNENSFAYKDYGGRGIKLSDAWLSDFINFYNDMQATYQSGLTIERNDVNGNYEKSNCCWITRSQQVRNRRCSRWIETLEGRMTITEAANKVGISYIAMFRRIRQNWPIEKLLIPSNFKQRINSYPKNRKKRNYINWSSEWRE